MFMSRIHKETKYFPEQLTFVSLTDMLVRGSNEGRRFYIQVHHNTEQRAAPLCRPISFSYIFFLPAMESYRDPRKDLIVVPSGASIALMSNIRELGRSQN